jgi:hypothetical protein
VKHSLQECLKLGEAFGGKTPRDRFPARYLQRRKQLQRTPPPVAVAHLHRSAPLCRPHTAFQLAGLDGGLLINAHHQMPPRASACARAYSRKIGRAFSRNRGSGDCCQQRYCHGLICSACSQRFTVEGEMRFTMRSCWAARTNSGADHRDNGLLKLRGSVHANAVSSARCSEGKKARTTAPWCIGQNVIPVPAPSPAAHSASGATHLACDLGIGPVRMLVCRYHNLGAQYLGIRSGRLPRKVLELSMLLAPEQNAMGRLRPSGHSVNPPWSSNIGTAEFTCQKLGLNL